MEDGQGNGDVLERDGLLDLLVLIYLAQQRLGSGRIFQTTNETHDLDSHSLILASSSAT